MLAWCVWFMVLQLTIGLTFGLKCYDCTNNECRYVTEDTQDKTCGQDETHCYTVVQHHNPGHHYVYTHRGCLKDCEDGPKDEGDGFESVYTCCQFDLCNYISGTGEEMIVAPVNTAAERGSFARLNCTADLTIPGGGEDTLEWRHYLDDTTGTRIVVSTNPDDVNGEAYNLDYDVDEGRYDLLIDMSKDVGGNYNCHIFVADTRGEAQLVALDQFNCGTRNGITEVVEGQIVALDCGVSYKGYKKPSLEWASENGMQPGYYVDDEDNPEKVFYVANVTAQPEHDKMVFTCSLAFEREDGEEEEPPRYRDTCTTSFEVLHGATDIEIYPNPDNSEQGIIDINVGEEMNCSASGNPEPTIYWYDNEGGIVSEDETMLITDDMITDDEEPVEYKCVASNWINMVEHKTEKTVQIRVSGQDATTRPPTEEPTPTEEPPACNPPPGTKTCSITCINGSSCSARGKTAVCMCIPNNDKGASYASCYSTK